MGYANLAAMGAFMVVLGVISIFGGLYPGRGGHLRHRQGAKVLLGFAVLSGAVAIAVGSAMIATSIW